MSESQSQIRQVHSGEWQGTLAMERLYIGSKSEGDYPIFKTPDGQSFRLEIQSDSAVTNDLSHLIGCHLWVRGVSDALKGYRRIVTTRADIRETESRPAGLRIDDTLPDGSQP